MIEKIDLDRRNSYGTLDWLQKNNEPSGAKIIELKINELVDAINNIVSVQEKLIDSRFVVEAKHEEPADQYAEQRKWIGKLCRFWNFKDGEVDIGILKAIDNLKPTIPYINDIDCSYTFCEPVKPDDEIIYKDSDND